MALSTATQGLRIASVAYATENMLVNCVYLSQAHMSVMMQRCPDYSFPESKAKKGSRKFESRQMGLHPPDFCQHYNSSSSHVTLHEIASRLQAKMTSTECRDAWLCKGKSGNTHTFDSHVVNHPVDVLNHIHFSTRDPLHLRARNSTSPLLAAGRRFFITIPQRIWDNAIRCGPHL